MDDAATAPIEGFTIYDPDDPFEMRTGPLTMIDLALAATAKEVIEDRYVTISLNSEFVAAGNKGEIIEATGELVRRTRSIAFVRGQVHVGDRVLLTASGVFKKLRAA